MSISVNLNSRPWDRNGRLRALAQYANLGDDPSAWEKFRTHWKDFVPSELYQRARERAAQAVRLSPQYLDSPDDPLGVRYALLFYRDRLREVWTRNDPKGIALCYLYGFHDEAIAMEDAEFARAHPMAMPRPILAALQGRAQPIYRGLRPGSCFVNGITGAIEWSFPLPLQQALYLLMAERWRAMVCPVCGRFFVATETASKYCSTRCSQAMKLRRANEYFRRAGAAKRAARMEKLRKTSTGRDRRRT